MADFSKPIDFVCIEDESFGKYLEYLRNKNVNLQKRVCAILRKRSDECDATECENCKYDMDNHISRRELGDVLGVSDSTVANWEDGRSRISIECLFAYEELTGIDVHKLVRMEE